MAAVDESQNEAAAAAPPQQLMSDSARDAQIRSVLASIDEGGVGGAIDPDDDDDTFTVDDKPGTTQPAKTEPAKVEAKAPEKKPDEKKDQPKKDWTKLVEEDRKQVATRKQLEQREAKVKEAEEASELLKKNPLEYAKRFGGPDFAKRFVTASVNGGEETPADVAARVAREENDKLRAELHQRDAQSQLNTYRDAIYVESAKVEDPILGAFYDDTEIRDVGQNLATHVYGSTERLLTASEAASTLQQEVVDRIRRVAATPSGQKLLRSMLETPAATPKDTPSPPKQNDSAAAAGPKTLTRNLDASSPPPGQPARSTKPPSENPALIEAAMRAVAQ